MNATAKNGDVRSGERNGDWWVYRDGAGRLYESKEIPAYRIALNVTQVICSDGRLAIAPMKPQLTEVEYLNKLLPGWSESCPGGLLCNPHPQGAIIDNEHVSKEWFVVFNDSRETITGYATRGDAIEGYLNSSRQLQSH